jgi:ATP-dependent DNA ligase
MTLLFALPSVIKPMRATSGRPFDDENFLFEIKWDGMRMLAFIEAGGYRLLNRHGRDATARFPEFAFLTKLAPGTILDGEMMVLRDGTPDFALLQSRDKTRSALKIRTLSRVEPATYIVFDVLYENHVCLFKEPLQKRRQRLEGFLQRWIHPRLVLSQSVLGRGRALFTSACEQGLEGIMAKRLDSQYCPGRRSRDWLTIKPRQARAIS